MKARTVLLLLAGLAQTVHVGAFPTVYYQQQLRKQRTHRFSGLNGYHTRSSCRFQLSNTLPRRTTIQLLSSSSDFSEASSNNSNGVSRNKQDPEIIESVKVLRRASWFSWWSQVILTTVASVILIFAKSVQNRAPTSFFLSGAGLLISFCSIIWTWGNGSRLSRRLTIKPATRYTAAQMLRRAVRVGVTLNCVGLLCGLLAAQQIIGNLAIKVLTQRNLFTNTGGALLQEGLQPLDVLVVQANTNALLSQFCSLISLLWLTNMIGKLDPPSTDEYPRRTAS